MSVDALVEKIEKECALQAKQAREAYKVDMKALTDAFKAEQRKIEFREKERLKEIERSRITAIGALKSLHPVQLSDIRSVKRDVEDGFERKAVSVPRLAFLERKEGAA